jgi:hypothetical protein
VEAKHFAEILKALSHPYRLDLNLEITGKSESGFNNEEHKCYITDIMAI